MIRKKLGICVGASIVSLAGATYLAQPASASGRVIQCNQQQWAQADADASAYCRSTGQGGGYAGSCDASGSGTGITVVCQRPKQT